MSSGWSWAATSEHRLVQRAAGRSAGSTQLGEALGRSRPSTGPGTVAAERHRLPSRRMHPGTFAETTPDKPAVVMDDGRHAHLPRSSRSARTSSPTCSGTPGCRPATTSPSCSRTGPRCSSWPGRPSAPGSTTRPPPPGSRPSELGYIVDDCGARVLLASAATVDAASAVDGAQRRAAPPARRRLGRRLGVLRRGRRRPAHHADRRPGRGRRHALQLGHHRPTQGRQGAAAATPVPQPRRAVGGARRHALRRRRRTTVYLSPAPLYHAAPLRFSMAAHRLGATVVAMEHFDPERFLRLDRAAPGHLHPGRAHHVHPPAQAARGGARPLRPVVAEGRRPRRRALPGRGQGADDRVVGAGHPRVLRRHRGQRLRLLQQRAVAGPQGHGRRLAARPAPHPRRGRRGGPRRRGRHHLLRGRRRASSTTTTPRRRRARATRRAGGGRRSATSATSTTTGSSTSPTARRT